MTDDEALAAFETYATVLRHRERRWLRKLKLITLVDCLLEASLHCAAFDLPTSGSVDVPTPVALDPREPDKP
jgi:hypothetical protein